ncbi:MAG: hypothetical protein P8Y61_09925 [Gammaproteobacteria bacterium]
MLVNLCVFLIVAAILEIFLRLTVKYDIGYYTGTKTEGIAKYPFGEIVINSDGFADQEFDLTSTKPRIGYFGDSVNYGIGAGYPYRFSELVETVLPEYSHWNLGGGVSSTLQTSVIADNAKKYGLDYAVYLLNLNDILPLSRNEDFANAPFVFRLKWLVKDSIDGLRDRSYLYNFIRLKVKNAFQVAGFEASGYKAFELWPQDNLPVLKQFSARVNETNQILARDGITFCVVLLPYEMQVSKDAERVYSEMGFKWEDGFTEGSTQKMLRELIDVPYVYDPLPEFDREAASIGEYFVYNKGDKIDWNHPNRKGHAVITEGFLQAGACPFVPSRMGEKN